MAEDQHGRRRGRPSTPVLTQRKIAAAAVTLIQSRGYRGLTMAAVAEHLGVSASALYNHVGSKRELMILVQDRVNREIDCSGFDHLPWDHALALWARSYRAAYARNTPLIPVIAVLPVADSPATLQMYERVAAGLAEGGWPAAWITHVIVAVESLVFGAAYDATAPASIFEPGELADLAPVFTEAVAHRASAVLADDAASSSGAEPATVAFELALEAMLDGLRARLAGLRAQD